MSLYICSQSLRGPQGLTGSDGSPGPSGGVNLELGELTNVDVTSAGQGSVLVCLSDNPQTWSYTGSSNLRLGKDSGLTNQGNGGIDSGKTNQGTNSIAIRSSCGTDDQDSFAIAIGSGSGTTGQGKNAISIGDAAGTTDQSIFSIAIGTNAGTKDQGQRSVCIGLLAGQNDAPEDSILIGHNTGNTILPQTCIILKATDATGSINPTADNGIITGGNNGFYAKPVRFNDDNTNPLSRYDRATGEIYCSTT